MKLIEYIRPNGQRHVAQGDSGYKRRALQPQPARKCPDWLYKQYRSNLPVYAFDNGNFNAVFLRVEWRNDVKSYVGIYHMSAHLLGNHREQWSETYIWLVRNGQWSEVRQKGTRYGYRRQVGWAKA